MLRSPINGHGLVILGACRHVAATEIVRLPLTSKPLLLPPLATTLPLVSIVALPPTSMPSEEPVAFTVPPPLMVRLPSASMPSAREAVEVMVPSPEMLMSPADLTASLVASTVRLSSAPP